MKSTLRSQSAHAILLLWIAGASSFALAQDNQAQNIQAQPNQTQDADNAALQKSIDKWAQHFYDLVEEFEQDNAAHQNVVIVGSSHVERLDEARFLPRWHVINRGIGSDRIGISERGILHRLDNSVFDCHPDIIVIQNGVNDLGELWRHGTPSVDEIETGYRTVVQRIRSRLPDVPVIIVGLFPTREKYAELIPNIKELDRRYQQIAQDTGCTYLEMYSHLADEQGELRKEFSREGLHMTDAGYQIWAKLLDQALEEVSTPHETVLDPASATQEPESELLWYDAQQLVIEGKGWTDTENFYERLPARAKQDVPSMVWNLSKDTAGLVVRFATDAQQISAIWNGGGAMNHMAATGNSGLDLYAKHGDHWEFCAVGRPQTNRTTAKLATNLDGVMTEYLLYLPLYNNVTELRIGIESRAKMVVPSPRPANRAQPIVFYGTSITQGGCASRAGMCHPAMLGRWLNREVINLGFSGSGKMEPELAQLVSELDAAVFVLECLPNMTPQMVRERVQPFVKTLRAAHPDTPILLVASPLKAMNSSDNHALRDAFTSLLAVGVGRLYYLPGEVQLAGAENGTVDGVHPTDLGFYRMAEAYKPILQSILASLPQERAVQN